MLIAAGVLLMAAAGYFVARPSSVTTSSASFDRYATVGTVRVSYPSDWHRASAGGAAALGLTRQFALEPARTAGQQLMIGEGQGSGPSLLPAAMLKLLDRPPSPEIVTLGSLSCYRYLHLSLRGVPSPESVYALRTTTGSVIGVCIEGSISAEFASSCERVLSTLHVTSGSALAPGLSTAYARALNGLLRPLNQMRRRAGSQLGAHRLAARLSASEALAKAHARAAAALATVASAPVGGANRALTEALKMSGDAYQQLARAIHSRSVSSYRRAQAALRAATASLELAFARLRTIGYRVG